MNTKLNFLLKKYNLSEKDIFEIKQFYSLLSEERKKNLLDKFENFAKNIKKIDEDIKIEKQILISDAVNIVRETILKKRRKEKTIL